MSVYDDFLGVDHALESLLARKSKDADVPHESEADPNSPEELRLLRQRRRPKIRWGLVALVSIEIGRAHV